MIYFSDPPPRPPLTPPEHTPELDIAGVYRVSPDLKEINMIVRDFVNPNGLCFSPDEKILYVNDSNRHRKLIRAYDVEGNGMVDLGSERLFCDMRGDDRPGGPDGMKCDVEGNVYCTGPGGIWVISPAGEHIGTILQRAVNLNWGDDDWQTLYFTGPTTLHRIRLNIPGIPVPRGAGMKRSSERILTTHVGSLVRPPEILEAILAKVSHRPYDEAAFQEQVRAGRQGRRPQAGRGRHRHPQRRRVFQARASRGTSPSGWAGLETRPIERPATPDR